LFPTWAVAQPRHDATLRVTVVDPSGAVIVGAQVTVKASAASSPVTPVSTVTSGRGDALFDALEPGRHSIHVESAGFESYDASDVRLRAGENRREAKLKIARLAETVQVGRDARERASDPRGDAFSTALGQAQIDELPDDPDEMEQVLRDMAGPGATLRVNGFRGGKLPPKSQIQSIRFRRNMFAADVHEAGFTLRALAGSADHLHRLLIHQARRQLRHLSAAAMGKAVEEDRALGMTGRNQFGVRNTLVPPSEYSPLTVTEDASKKSVTVYNQSAATRGLFNNVWGNQDELAVDYHGVGIDLVACQVCRLQLVFKAPDRLPEFDFERLEGHLGDYAVCIATRREQILQFCKTCET